MKSVKTVKPQEVFNLLEIGSAYGSSELELKLQNTTQLITTEHTLFQEAIELSVSFLMAKGRLKKPLPEEFASIHGQLGFSEKLISYFKNRLQMQLPTEQVCFSLVDVHNKNFQVAKLHIADLLFDRWCISDIVLQRRMPPPNPNLIGAEFAGLGRGIFDGILRKLEETAREAEVEHLCLVAATPANRDMFKKRGFEMIPETEIPAQLALAAEHFGRGFHMWKAM